MQIIIYINLILSYLLIGSLSPFSPLQTLREFFTTSAKWKPQEAPLVPNDEESVEEGQISTANSTADILRPKAT